MPSIVKSSAKSKSKPLLRTTAAGLKNKIKLKVKKAAARVGLAPRNGAGKHAAPAKSSSKGGIKRTYFFAGGKSEGSKEMKNLLGGKGANLAEMANIGLPVPPGFTITTEVCTEFYKSGKKLPKGLDGEVRASIARMEKLVGAKFGDAANPLLVSVRSGARASMPGMM